MASGGDNSSNIEAVTLRNEKVKLSPKAAAHKIKHDGGLIPKQCTNLDAVEPALLRRLEEQTPKDAMKNMGEGSGPLGVARSREAEGRSLMNFYCYYY
ncbi:hypothetical protein MMC28_002733 [Mycoblastus sanguinarius]|nr:hypothetical protein [Mycoblastus sanguinarius]